MSEQRNNFLPTISEYYRSHRPSDIELADAWRRAATPEEAARFKIDPEDTRRQVPMHLEAEAMKYARFTKEERKQLRKQAEELHFEEFGWERTTDAREVVEERARAAEEAARTLADALPDGAGRSAEEFITQERERARQAAADEEAAKLEPVEDPDYLTKRELRQFEEKRALYRELLLESPEAFRDIDRQWRRHEQMRLAAEIAEDAKEARKLDKTFRISKAGEEALEDMLALDYDGHMSRLHALGLPLDVTEGTYERYDAAAKKFYEKVTYLETTKSEDLANDKERHEAQKLKDAKERAADSGIDVDAFIENSFVENFFDAAGFRGALEANYRGKGLEGEELDAHVDVAAEDIIALLLDVGAREDFAQFEAQLRKYELYAKRRARALSGLLNKEFGGVLVQRMREKDFEKMPELQDMVSTEDEPRDPILDDEDLGVRYRARKDQLHELSYNQGSLIRVVLRGTVEAQNINDRVTPKVVAAREKAKEKAKAGGERVKQLSDEKRQAIKKRFDDFALSRALSKPVKLPKGR